MYKIIKKLLKMILWGALIIIILLLGTLTYLYLSADTCKPTISEEIPNYELISEPDYRQWGDNYLRKSETGLWELKVSGSDYNRGVAIGKMSEDLLYYQEKVFVDQINEIIPSKTYLRFLGGFTLIFNRNLGKHVPEENRREILGISQYCSDEFDYISSAYDRQLNYHAAHDLGHAMQDYMLVGCSSFATWQNKSADSTLIIGRNFDFYVGDDFAKNKQIQFYEPEKGYKFVSVAWPGMTGVLSGMNEEGLTVTINAAKSEIPTSAKMPISLLVREILQYASNIDEAYKIAESRSTFVSESLLIGSAKDKKAAIIEKSPSKTVLLFSPENNNQIISTNHYQSSEFADNKRNIENIKNSDSQYRYKRLEELLSANYPIDAPRAASILRNHLGVNDENIGLANEKAINQFICHHSVIFKPEERIIWVSTDPWQVGRYVAYDLNKIFNGETDFTKEIYSAEYEIPADTILKTETFKNLLDYKYLTKYIRKNIYDKNSVPADSLAKYESSNPEFYYTYELLGDYYKMVNDKNAANNYWQKALTKEIPKVAEKERIEKKIRKNTSVK